MVAVTTASSRPETQRSKSSLSGSRSIFTDWLSPARIDNDCPFPSALVSFFRNTDTRPFTTFTALPSSLAAIQSGQVRAIGIAATERSPELPDVPTFTEQGVTGQDADTLTGIVAPAGTPKEIVELLAREIASSVAQPDLTEKLAKLGFKPVANTPDEFAARIKVEIEKWGKVVRDANLRIE